MNSTDLLVDVLKLWETARRFDPAVSVQINQLATEQGRQLGLDALRKGKVVAYAGLRLLRKMGLEDCSLAGANLLTIGCALYGEGSYRRALRYLDRAVALHRRHLGLADRHYWTTLFHWARTHDMLGEGEQVIGALEECITGARDNRTHSLEMEGLEDLLGGLYQRFRDPARARRLLEQVLAHRIASHGRDSRQTVEGMIRLAGAIEQDATGMPLIQGLVRDACDIVDSHAGVFWADKASASVFLCAADLAKINGEVEQEAHHLRRVLRTMETAAADQDPSLAQPALRLARNRLTAGMSEEAMEALAALHARGPELDWIAPTDRKEFIELYVRTAQELAIEIPLATLLREWIDTSVMQFRQTFPYLDAEPRLPLAQQFWRDIRKYLGFLSQACDQVDPADIQHAYQLVLEFKGIVAESLCISKERRLIRLYPQHQSDLERLSELRRLRSGPWSGVFQGLPESEWERCSSRLKFEQVAIEARLHAQIPFLLEPSEVTLGDVVNCLPIGSLLLDFVRVGNPDGTANGLVVFVVQPGHIPLKMIRLCDWEFVATEIFAWRSQIEAGNEPHDTALDQILLQPLTDCDCLTKLYYSADDILHWIPLQALRPKEAEGFLIQRMEVVPLETSRDLLTAETRTGPGGTPLVVGLNQYPNSAMPALHFAESEAQEIAQLLGGESWIGAQRVSQTNLMVRLGHIDAGTRTGSYLSPSILHIASHGSSEAILLADGTLDVPWVSALDLRDTKLATLSACSSGLGFASAGEGVLGLRRAFRMAGVQTLVVSLWPVDDIATTLLMKAFYSRHKAGMAPDVALRSAQLALRERFPSPYYWAGFVCI